MAQRYAPRASPPRQAKSSDAPYSLARAVQEFKCKYVENILRLTNGDCDEAAALLGIAPQEVRELIAQHQTPSALAERRTSDKEQR